jgi:hypothetical protein
MQDSYVLNSDLIKTDSTNLNHHNESVWDVDVLKEMTEIKQDISLDDIKEEPGFKVSSIFFLIYQNIGSK